MSVQSQAESWLKANEENLIYCKKNKCTLLRDKCIMRQRVITMVGAEKNMKKFSPSQVAIAKQDTVCRTCEMWVDPPKLKERKKKIPKEKFERDQKNITFKKLTSPGFGHSTGLYR